MMMVVILTIPVHRKGIDKESQKCYYYTYNIYMQYMRRRECMARIALFQMQSEIEISENLIKSIAAVKEAAEQGADLILFPEVHLTEFFPQYPGSDAGRYAVSIESDIVRQFRSVCQKHRIMAVPNVYLNENGRLYDASILIGRDGNIIGIQKMVHIAQMPHFYEQDYYAPSDEGFGVFDTDIGKVGIVVCFDRHYPESIRTEALMGAELILIPTVNTLTEPLEMFEWEMRVDAFRNSAAAAMCNRVGSEGEMNYAGRSVIINANGNIAARANGSECILYADIELQRSTELRNKKPYTGLRRTEYYK